MWSLFLGLLALIVYEKKEIAWIWRMAFVGLCCILAYPGNWNFVAVIWIWGFGVFRDQPWKKWGMFLVDFGVHVALFFVVQTNGTLWTRFAVLAAIPEAVTRADTPQQAAAALQTALPALQNAADNALHRAHSAQTACLRLERFAFAARDYGSFALPGGEYTALRIELGGAQGRNWFCVLYPALCLSGAQSDYPTKAENALVFGRYEVRFALAELVGRMASPSGEAVSGPAR